MHSIPQKTLSDLEFYEILNHIASFCSTDMGREKVLKIKPISDSEILLEALHQTSEYLSSFENNNAIESHYFESISQELQWLRIENTCIETSGFRKIHLICKNTFNLIIFFEKFKNYYPHIYQISSEIIPENHIVSTIEAVFDRFWEIKNDASDKLFQIRQRIQETKAKIQESFQRALMQYRSLDYLDDIGESVLENRRVLAVKAMYRRRIKGVALGTSKTGSIVFIEPQQTEHLSRELSHLYTEEKEEIYRILKQLTDFLRSFHEILEIYQNFLTQMDVIYAKAKFAAKINGVLPLITSEKILFLRDAYHPLLYLNHQKKGQKTYPQTVHLHSENRIIVISGPNAGGKSITLKTIGLLQLMLQSGMLIPVHPKSQCSFFDRILTDIGDNQSIENHLSTYSYRLKNMNYFLRKCNEKTLFLIDEFGTGSDPELGGALAETFLEEFYHRQAFGVITTHYANLKMLANELPHISNANMLFDHRTLEPIFRLVIGEAGSSFTFEVAQKNGIPFSLINRAKKKIEKGKVRFDATIAQLQKERAKMEKVTSSLKKEEEKNAEETLKWKSLNEKIQNKLSNYQELYDRHQRMISLGSKVDELAQRYFETQQRRPLISNFLKLIQTENAKRKQNIESKSQPQIKPATENEILKKIQQIRERKQQQKKQKELEQLHQKKSSQLTLKIGDRVRISESKSVGTIDKIEKGKALINYGFFTTFAPVEKLELVEKKS